MMKSLLTVIASLTMLSAGAQANHAADLVAPQQPQASTAVKPKAEVREMKMRKAGETVAEPLRSTGEIKPYYRRPAGAFYSSQMAVDGMDAGVRTDGILMMKPYCDYTFYSFGGADEDDEFIWDYDAGGEYYHVNAVDLTVNYGIEVNDAPGLSVLQNGDDMNYYFFQYPRFRQSDGGGLSSPTKVYSVPTTRMIDEDVDYLLSSKTFCVGGRNGDQETLMTYYSGAQPYGNNAAGWWFGKNGYHQNYWSSYYVDGIAQAFEKPTEPYLLKKVVMQCAVLEVLAPVDMNCKIYTLNRIPGYDKTASVSLPDEPGELIAMGRARVTPRTFEDMGGMVTFDLYRLVDGIECEIEPTIDSAILVVVEGYNDTGMANLQDFSAYISSDMEVDEGFGELAYIKYGTKDANHNVTFSWKGLNNFFYDGTMKTGFSIYIVADMPYLVFNNPDENGVYEFDAEGGPMQRQIGDETVAGIEFKSWTPSANNDWMVTCHDEEPPEWLDIELVDGEQGGEFNNIVTALVTADPLPEGLDYREAVVRFAIPGAYLDYKFIQGKKVGPEPGLVGDFNGDGEVNIADLNYLINLILTDAGLGDITGDGETNIADINALIDIILSKV